MKQHIHAELIKQWADGAEIEYSTDGITWRLAPTPMWFTDAFYRLKQDRVFRYGWLFRLNNDTIKPSEIWHNKPTSTTNVMATFVGNQLIDIQMYNPEEDEND